MMMRLVVCSNLMALFRITLRLFLVLSGNLEWRGWYVSDIWNFWPTYETAWTLLYVPIAIFYIWYGWRQLFSQS